MRKQIIFALFVLSPCFGQRAGIDLIGHSGTIQESFAATPGMTIQGTTEKIGAKFYAKDTQAFTSVGLYLGVSGTLTGINWKYDVETDNADQPSGTLAGTATAEFTLSATGLTLQSISTGALSLNTPYWIVMYYSSGTAPTGSNYVSLYGSSAEVSGGRCRHYNGSDWTTTTPYTRDPDFIAQLTDGTYFGLASTGLFGQSAHTAIYGTNRQGVRWKYGGSHVVDSVGIYMTVGGTPNPLEISLYAGDTLQETLVIPAASIVTLTTNRYRFVSAHTIPANTYAYIILHQQSDGGNTGNFYKTEANTVNATYSPYTAMNSFASVYGTSVTPSGLTVSYGETPAVFYPITTNATTGLISGSQTSHTSVR